MGYTAREFMSPTAVTSLSVLALLTLAGCAGQPRKWGAEPRAAAPAAEVPAAANSKKARPATDVETTSASVATPCEGAQCIGVCDASSDGDACKEAGYALRDGTGGVETNFGRAAVAFDKSCKKKNRYGCHELAKAYSVGEGVTADAGKAVGLYTTACDLGVGQACDDLAKMNEKGEGVAKDHQKAVELLARGCVAEDYQVWTCASLRKAEVAKDKAAMKIVGDWQKACKKSKDELACRGLERLAPKAPGKADAKVDAKKK